MFSRIPGATLGILFFLIVAPAAFADNELARALFNEGDWPASRREAQRSLSIRSDDGEAHLIAGASALRMNFDSASAVKSLERAMVSADDAGIRSEAAFELGLWAWREREPDRAAAWLIQAFTETPSFALFLRSAWALDRFFREYPEAAKAYPAAKLQVETCGTLVPPDAARAWAALLNPGREDPSGALVARWVVGFYRTWIGPAIGARCSLEPSCSHYFVEACRRNGLAGFAMMADRFFREPDVVKQARHPVRRGDERRYADPVADHDFWRAAHTEGP